MPSKVDKWKHAFLASNEKLLSEAAFIDKSKLDARDPPYISELEAMLDEIERDICESRRCPN